VREAPATQLLAVWLQVDHEGRLLSSPMQKHCRLKECLTKTSNLLVNYSFLRASAMSQHAY